MFLVKIKEAQLFRKLDFLKHNLCVVVVGE